MSVRNLRIFKGRSSKGIRGYWVMAPNDEIVSLAVVNQDKSKKNNKNEKSDIKDWLKDLFCQLQKMDMVKKLPINDYRVTNRGGKGIIGIS